MDRQVSRWDMWRIDSGCVDGWVDGEVNEGTDGCVNGW